MNLNKIYFTFIFLIFISLKSNSQIINAKITYKIKINIQNHSVLKLDNDRGKFLKLIFKEINSIEMELVYFKDISVFKESQQIFISKKQESFHKLAKTSARLGEVYYNNLKNNTSSIYRNFGGVDYLITSDFNTEWKLINENKVIGGFKCQKAETIYTYKDRKDNYQKLKITAWFTPEVPISSGPKGYNGLPGLILELNEGENFIVFQASKVQINSKNISEIHVPNDVKIITQNEFNKIAKESYEGFLKY